MARWLPRDVRAGDVAVALGVGLVMAGIVVLFPRTFGTLLDLRRPGLLVATAISTVLLVFRRRAPITVSLLVSLVSVGVPGSWIQFAALYAVGAYSRHRAWLWLPVVASVAAWFVALRGWVDLRVNDHAYIVVMSTLFLLAGLYVGTRRALVATAEERAARAEREQDLLAEQARAEERVRLAAEMHDVVTHRVNLMVLQAGALGVQSTDPAAREAAEAVRTCGVAALAELRDLVGVLRSGGDPATAAGDARPTGELATLVAESRSVGVEVSLREDGDPGVLAPTVHRTLVRVAQEALTNARKHAAGAAVEVTARYGEGGASIRVENAAPPDPAAAGDDTGGRAGLEGLRRRVALVGGTFTAGPRPGGGFAVGAELPVFVPTGPGPEPR